jgi:glycosyltransferase involved in cell wall biosynthesis
MSAVADDPFLSFIIPVHDEEENVAPLHAELTSAAAAVGRPYEILFVNDGSRDATLAHLKALRRIDDRLRIVDLAGNFGEAGALSAGFAHAQGEVVVTLDGDGQNDPSDVTRLLAMLGDGVDVVSGRRRERREAFWTRVLPSRIANWLIVRVTGVPVYDCGCGLKAYRREIVAGAQIPRGMNRFLPAILGVDPERVTEVWVNDRSRQNGSSHYGLTRTFAVLRDLPVLPHLRGASRAAARAKVAIALAGAAVLADWLFGRTIAVAVVAATIVASVIASSAIAYNLRRVARARASGVFRVREVM